MKTLLSEALQFMGREAPGCGTALREAIARFEARQWSVLVSGLCSVGKSSFVCTLWGDSELLPTAVRDCTQTNTRVRIPGSAGVPPAIVAGGTPALPREADRHLRVSYLSRAEAAAFVTKGFSYYRLAEMLSEVLGPQGPRLEELPPEPRLRAAIAAVKKLCAQRPDILVLHDYVTDELEQLEQFMAFLESPEYRPGETVPAAWDERRDLLMGLRRPDGRTLDTGKLWTLRHVEMIRRSEGLWQGPPPVLIDTPWIPQFHEARRVDLIVEQAQRADLWVIVALPQPFQLEEWVLTMLHESPHLAKRILVVFNQVDTIDTLALFTREGFANSFAENAKRLATYGIDPANLCMACARLPYLAGLPQQDDLTAERILKLQRVLSGIRKQIKGRPDSNFKSRLLAACDPGDAGIVSLRRKLEELAAEFVLKQRAREALDALEALTPSLNLSPSATGKWSVILKRAGAISASIRSVFTANSTPGRPPRGA